MSRFNPFPGLRPFEPEEDHLFFGRAREIDELLRRLRGTRFLSVVGGSGSGKSSLVRSGLVPSLYSGYMVTAGSTWRVAVTRPGGDPIGQLSAALDARGVLGVEGELADIHRLLLETTLRRSASGLADCVRQARIPAHENVLVVVDQFEELFRFKQSRAIDNSRDEAVAFVKLLIEAARQKEVPVYIVLTMRSDFIGDCMEIPGLPEAINEAQYLVPRMTRDELREAIVGPVRVGGGEITPRLVVRLLNDVGDDPDQLPVLQHALMRAWDHWQEAAPERPLDLPDYEAIGTMAEALSRHADEAYEEIPGDEGRQAAGRIFKALTDTSSDPRGVRRPASIAELARISGAGEDAVVALVERFRRPGRTFLMPPPAVELDAGSIVDLSHESLMRCWRRLIEWAEEERASAQAYRRLSRAAARHQAGTAGLWRDPELAFGLQWREENQPTAAWAERYEPGFERAMAFLDASRAERERRAAERERERRRKLRRARWLAAVLGSAAVITLLFGLWAMALKQRAEQAREEALAQRQVAEEKRREAEEQRLRAEAARTEAETQRERAEDSERDAVDQRERAVAARTEAESQRARAEDNESEAVAQREQAVAARTEAETQRARAEDNEREALTQKRRAEEREAEARRLRRLSLARQLAAATAQLEGGAKHDLGALLAVEAHRLARENGGDPDGPEIFDALRWGLGGLVEEGAGRLDQPAEVRAVAISADGTTLASGLDDGQILLFDLASGTPPATPAVLSGPGSAIRSLAFSASGARLAAGRLGGSLELWDPGSGAPTPVARVAHDGPVNAVAFAPRGDLLASGGREGVSLRELGGPAERVHRLSGSGEASGGVTSVAFSADGAALAAATSGGVVVWRVDRPAEAPTVLAADRAVRSVAFDPAGERLATGGRDGEVLLWNLSRPAEEAVELTRHASAVNALAFSPSAEVLATAGMDGEVRLLRLVDDAGPPIVLDDHSSWVWALAFEPGGDRLFSGGSDRTVRIFPTRADRLAEEICQRVSRNLTPGEWTWHLAADIDYRETCPGTRTAGLGR